jgi:hypothetical protein
VIEAILHTEIEDETDVLQTGDQHSRTTLAKFLRNKQLDVLSPQEASAIYYNLIGNVQAFKATNRPVSDNGIKRLIADAQLLNVTVDASNSGFHLDRMSSDTTSSPRNAAVSNGTRTQSPDNDDRSDAVENGGRVLYKRGRPCDSMCIILDGFVEVRAGEEGYLSEARRWYVLGQSALKFSEEELAEGASVNDLHPHMSDFDAIVVSTSRILRITRQAYINEIRRTRGIQPLHDPEAKATEESESKDGEASKKGSKIDLDAVIKSGLAHHIKRDNPNQLLPHVAINMHRAPSPQPGTGADGLDVTRKTNATGGAQRRTTTAYAVNGQSAAAAQNELKHWPPHSARNRPNPSAQTKPDGQHLSTSYSPHTSPQSSRCFTNLITDLKRQRTTTGNK